MKFPLKTVAACAVTAMAVGATSATAASMITSSQIKDGAVHMVDLSPGVQAKLHKAMASSHGKDGRDGKNGANGAIGANGANGIDGAKGADGVNGKDGVNGTNGTNGVNGAAGQDGKDGIRYDRVVDSSGVGEVSIADGVAKLSAPDNSAYAQIKTYPTGLKVDQIEELSFDADASDWGTTWLKITTTGHNTIVFSPNTQADGEQIGSMEHYNVKGEGSTVRVNDDAGFEADIPWNELGDEIRREHVKDIRVTNGSAQDVGVDGAVTLIDNLRVNDQILDFSWVAENRKANTPDHVASAIERTLRGRWIQETKLRNRLEKRLRELRAAK